MPFTVDTYQDPAQVLEATGIELVTFLDENLLESELETGDEVLTNGAYFTVVKGGTPADTQILGKGNLFTVIIETP